MWARNVAREMFSEFFRNVSEKCAVRNVTQRNVLEKCFRIVSRNVNNLTPRGRDLRLPELSAATATVACVGCDAAHKSLRDHPVRYGQVLPLKHMIVRR